MRYKWLWCLLVVVMIAICLYIFLPITHRTPSSIPNENRLKKMILDTGELNIDTILKQIAIDGKHVFIPHLSSDKQYGYSLLEWKDNKWEVTYVTSTGEPLLWKIENESGTIPNSF